jgi:tetratricopeptide (TPR) repeat protein
MTAGMCHYMKAQYPQAIQEYTKAQTMNPESTYVVVGLGVSFAKSGNRGAAYQAIEKLHAMEKDGYVSPAYIGLVYQALGDTDNEFLWYRKGYDDRAEWLLWLTVDPLYDGQRADPRFLDLVQKVGVAH